MAGLPAKVIDAHHHFLDTERNGFQSFLKSLVGKERYMPGHYRSEVQDALAKIGVKLEASVHIECIPDDGSAEVGWVESLINSDKYHTVKAIVGSCNLASPNVEEDLIRLKASSPKLRGVRWILDCVGKFDGGKTATHVATTRHDGVDYLRGSIGGYNGSVVADFEAGYALLEKHGLSFDLQCAPAQLLSAAELCARYPKIPVVIDHLGKPRMLLGDDDPKNQNTCPKMDELQVWREGMKKMAALQNVYVKISMLGYTVPGWIRTLEREKVVRELVIEVVDLFGPNRCMVATNWWKNSALSDSDGLSTVGPPPSDYYATLASWFKIYTIEERNELFYGTAKRFYRIY